MADSSRTDGSRAIDDEPDADRDAKIEQLLLAGLDHYFAARYELAINVWTRALFFDRSHARARAYIERARSALAERQRRVRRNCSRAAWRRSTGATGRSAPAAAGGDRERRAGRRAAPVARSVEPSAGCGPARSTMPSPRPAPPAQGGTTRRAASPPFPHRGPARSRFRAVLTMALLAAVALGAYWIATRDGRSEPGCSAGRTRRSRPRITGVARNRLPASEAGRDGAGPRAIAAPGTSPAKRCRRST